MDANEQEGSLQRNMTAQQVKGLAAENEEPSSLLLYRLLYRSHVHHDAYVECASV